MQLEPVCELIIKYLLDYLKKKHQQQQNQQNLTQTTSSVSLATSDDDFMPITSQHICAIIEALLNSQIECVDHLLFASTSSTSSTSAAAAAVTNETLPGIDLTTLIAILNSSKIPSTSFTDLTASKSGQTGQPVSSFQKSDEPVTVQGQQVKAIETPMTGDTNSNLLMKTLISRYINQNEQPKMSKGSKKHVTSRSSLMSRDDDSVCVDQQAVQVCPQVDEAALKACYAKKTPRGNSSARPWPQSTVQLDLILFSFFRTFRLFHAQAFLPRQRHQDHAQRMRSQSHLPERLQEEPLEAADQHGCCPK